MYALLKDGAGIDVVDIYKNNGQHVAQVIHHRDGVIEAIAEAGYAVSNWQYDGDNGNGDHQWSADVNKIEQEV